MDGLKIFSYSGEGLERSYQNEDWMVGIKNYKTASDLRYMDTLERHLLTDELFAPVTEGTAIAIARPAPGGFEITAEKMEPGRIYAVTRGTWHNAVMRPGAKLLLIERPGTGPDNSEFHTLAPDEKQALASCPGLNSITG